LRVGTRIRGGGDNAHAAGGPDAPGEKSGQEHEDSASVHAEKIHVDLLSSSEFYFFAAERGFDSLRKQSWRGQEPECANASFEWTRQQLVRRTVSGHGTDSPGTVLLICFAARSNFPED
jgi:hypothetical protein